MGQSATGIDKQLRYLELVESRRACRLCESLGLTNPSVCEGGVHDTTRHIGPWTQWQGDLNADLMVVWQDWSGEKYFVKHKGREEDTNATNKNLLWLLQSIGYRIPLPNAPKIEDGSRLYFTNAVLCSKPGSLVGSVPNDGVGNCARRFLCNQIELVRPKIVVTLGYEAYRAVCFSYGYLPARRMTEALGSRLNVGYSSVLVPVFHCGHYGSSTRSLERQKKDWERVLCALEQWKPAELRLACQCF
jgi:uracil DNA glycosylase superfamily protein